MQPGAFSVGQLYKGGYLFGQKIWNQPVPGGLVYPQLPTQFPQQNQGYYQQVMSYPSLYVAGCGHPFNCFEVFEAYDAYAGVQVALLCCPMCSYIQEIISPYVNYSNYETTPIVIG